MSPFASPFARMFAALSARPSAGRAANPRMCAISGLSPTAGSRAAGDPPPGFVNNFTSIHVPMLWQALIQEFPRQVDYWIDGDSAQSQPLIIIWKEGAEDEELSPGRYSHALVNDNDLPRPPMLGDVVSADGVTYDVVRVDAYAYKCSTIVLQSQLGSL